MQYEKTNLMLNVAMVATAMAAGALAVWQIGTHGALLSFIQDLQESSSGPVGFTQ